MDRALMNLPKCKTHSQMILRTPTLQSAEQKWCGTWYDCPQCPVSVLFPSPDLNRQLAEMREV